MTNVKVIQRMYRAFAERDYDTFKRMCAPDLVWIQNEGFPNRARHVGSEAVVEKVFKRYRNILQRGGGTCPDRRGHNRGEDLSQALATSSQRLGMEPSWRFDARPRYGGTTRAGRTLPVDCAT